MRRRSTAGSDCGEVVSDTALHKVWWQSPRPSCVTELTTPTAGSMQGRLARRSLKLASARTPRMTRETRARVHAYGRAYAWGEHLSPMCPGCKGRILRNRSSTAI